MAKEGQLERAFRNHCPGKTLKVTCPSQPGVPDRLVLLPSGKVVWVELKAKHRWPVRGKYRPGVTREQAIFLYDWQRWGGHAWLFTQVAQDYLLFTPDHARALVDGIPVSMTIEFAYKAWVSTPPWSELWDLL